MSLTKDQQQRLLTLARSSIAEGLKTGRPLQVDLADYPAELTALRATFVTLLKQNQLRGCIGMLEATRPLAEDIATNAFLAAFKDPRFEPLADGELGELEIHLSLLTPAEPVSFTSEQDLISQLQPGIDGLILAEGHRRGTFLPSVWEQLPQPKQFLQHLKQKAGLAPNYWSDTIKAYRYQTEIIS
ncbi:MAG: AmmeMemoRadiSam system protein A [Methylococcales bacterium]|nr:AmmeMemoRadiSam system protein A [Methylococcales bacterium]